MNLKVFSKNVQYDSSPLQFGKTYTKHSDLTSYNRKIDQARFLSTDFEMQDFLTSHFILITVLLL